MKKLYVKARQPEMPIGDQGFALIAESTQDGARLARERAEELAREEAAKAAQSSLF